MNPDTALQDSSPPAILIAIIRHLVGVAAQRGLPTQAILQAAGFDEDLLKDPGAWIPLSTAEKLLHAAVDIAHTPLFGLDFSRHVTSAEFGVLGFLTENCASLRDIFDITIRYEILVSDIGRTSLRYEPGVTLCCFDCKSSDPLFVREVTEHILGSWLRHLRLIDHPDWPLLEVRLRHAPPEQAELMARYEAIFQAPVRFNQDMSGFVISNPAMNYPLRHANAQLQEVLETHARDMLQKRNTNPNVIDQARSQLRRLLLQGNPSREALAEHMGVSGRHLHRLLEKAGSSYRALFDELRFELAQTYLQDGTLSVDAVAQRLHFQESQSFIRWFRTLAGKTPNEFRKARGDQSSPP